MIHAPKTRLAVWPSLVLAMLAIWVPSRSTDAAKRPKKPNAAAVQTSGIGTHSPDNSDAVGMVDVDVMRSSCGIGQLAKYHPVARLISTLVERWTKFSIEGQITPAKEHGIIDRDTSCNSDSCSVAPRTLRSHLPNAFVPPEFWAPGSSFLCEGEPGEYAVCPQSSNANVGKGESTLPYPATIWSAIITEAQRSAANCQVLFLGPDGTQVHFNKSQLDVNDSGPITCPGRYNFPSAAIHRLRLTDVPGHPRVEFYPTLEIGPVTPRTEAYLTHNAIPIQFEEEDFRKACQGEFVIKVVYLPDPEFQELALAGVETLVSTQLAPGVDPIVEADRRGAVLVVLRLSGRDIQKTVCEEQAPSQAAIRPQLAVLPRRRQSRTAVPRQAGTAPQTSHNIFDASEKTDNAIHLRQAARHLEAAGRSELAAQISQEALLATKLLQLEKLQTEIAALRSTITTDRKVVVQVKIMELQVSKMRKLGFDFRAADQTAGEERMIGKFVDCAAIDNLIPTLRQNGLVRVLAEPQIIAVSGRRTTFESGGELPVVSAQPAGNQPFEYRRFGTRLDCVPQVLADNRIRLDFNCTVSEIDTSQRNSVLSTIIPGLRTHSVDTAVDLVAGQTVILGGINRSCPERARDDAKVEQTSLFVAVTARPGAPDEQAAEKGNSRQHQAVGQCRSDAPAAKPSKHR